MLGLFSFLVQTHVLLWSVECPLLIDAALFLGQNIDSGEGLKHMLTPIVHQQSAPARSLIFGNNLITRRTT